MKPLSKEARELIEEIRKYGAMLDPSPYATPANEILNHFASLPDVYGIREDTGEWARTYGADTFTEDIEKASRS